MSDTEVYVSTHGDGPTIDAALGLAVTATQPTQAALDSIYDRGESLLASCNLLIAHLQLLKQVRT
jgi:hypothetical protein